MNQRSKIDKCEQLQNCFGAGSELLDEVVVTGYQTISRERATGSFAKVDSKKLENSTVK